MAVRDAPPHRTGRTAGAIAGLWPPRGAAQAGGFAPSGAGLWAPLAETLRAWARAEAGAGRLLPWVPVAFGAGIGLYFTVDREPGLSLAAPLAIGLLATPFLLRRSRCFSLLV